MIQSIRITNPKNESIKMELKNPWENGIAIYKIDGLGPAKANVNLTDLATGDGAIFSNARVTPRNIVIHIKPLDVEVHAHNEPAKLEKIIEEVRQGLYRYFPLKKQVKFEVVTTNRRVETYGIVESIDTDIFSKQSTLQISLLCPDPFFRSPQIEEYAFLGALPIFEFPFSNESLTENLLEFGILRDDSRANLYYEGEVDTGVLIRFQPRRTIDTGEIILFNVDTLETMTINASKLTDIMGDPFTHGDVIEVSTIRGNRYCRLLRRGQYTNVLSAFNRDMTWFQLTPGDNVFDFTVEPDLLALVVRFHYTNAFAGI